MKVVKVSEVSGAVLDWLVAKAQGDAPVFRPYGNSKGATIYRSLGLQHAGIDFRPSANWAQGGPIIEREGITVSKEDGGWSAYFRDNLFNDDGSEHWQTGPTALIAAMRCYVVSKRGETVEVPDDLLKSVN